MITDYKLWLSGGVNRWHQQDNPVLRNSNDTNWAHTGRVAQLVFAFGGSSEEILTALFHDICEKKTGDKCDGSKDVNDYVAENKVAADMGMYYPKTPLVHLCDKLDAYLWARLHGSGLSDDWQMSLLKIDKMAFDLGLADQVTQIVTDAG